MGLSVSSTFDAILSTLQLIGDGMLEGNDKSKAIEAVGLHHHIHCFKFVACLVTFTRIMSLTKSLSDQLQSKSLDLASASHLITATIDTHEK